MTCPGLSQLWPVVLFVFLGLLTFGPGLLLLLLYIISMLLGGLVVCLAYGRQQLDIHEAQGSLPLAFPPSGISKVQASMEAVTRVRNFDKRMTGSSVIDDVLNEVLKYAVRDYIKTWYRQISDHDGFLVDIWQCVQKVVITFSMRSKEVEWMPYFTQRLVDDFASHIRLYRCAVQKRSQMSKEEAEVTDIESIFFDLEVDMENNMCRDLICLSREDERQYLQDLSEVLLYLLLPKEDFHNKPFRYILREVLVNGIILPTVDLLSDPDYINQYIAWMCKENSFNKESFMTVIRSTDCQAELEAVAALVESNIARWRAKDSGGSDDHLIKQNLKSLMFLRDVCQLRWKRLEEGVPDPEAPSEEPDYLKYQNLVVLKLDDIINNANALQTFINFLKEQSAEQYMYFYLNVEGFRAAAEQQITAANRRDAKTMEPDLESLRQAAKIIYDQYLSDKATSRVKVESDMIKRVHANIHTKMLAEDIFDIVQARVYAKLLTDFYDDFLHSPAYVKLLGELGMLPDSKSEDGLTLVLEDVPRIMWFTMEDIVEMAPDSSSPDTVSLDSLSSHSSLGSPGDITVQIQNAGIVRESEKSQKYVVFAVTVRKRVGESEDDEEVWDVYRRYSDFHDFNMLVQEKFPDIMCVALPGKTVYQKFSKEFLEKRKKALEKYLKSLLRQEMWQKHPGLEDLIMQFLAPGLWEKHKSELARKMDTIVNPLRTSVKNVSHAVKSVPDGVSKLSDGIGKVFKTTAEMKGDDPLSSSKVGAGLDVEYGENIPLRIMLLLMEEVFDLQHKPNVLRRNLVTVMSQLIKKALGDKINRAIVEYVDLLTSAEQMAEYVKKFRDSFWPSGVLAEAAAPRDNNTRMRTRVLAKAKMLGSFQDDIKAFIGTDTIRHGIKLVFDMFQHRNLNRRLVYVVLEGALHNVLPDHKFPELYRKLHSRSKRVSRRPSPAPEGSQLRKRQGR